MDGRGDCLAKIRTVTVFVVAANRFFRDSLASLLDGKEGLSVVGANGFSPQSLEQITEINPCVVVLSPDWSDTEFRVTRAIREVRPQTRILMITMQDDASVFIRAVRAGAVGYLLKEASAEEIVSAVRHVGRGSVLCPRQLEHALFGFVANPVLPRALELTSREEHLASLVAEGLTNKEIAVRLNLSEQTVKNHVHSILRKTGSRSRAMIAQFVERQPLDAYSGTELLTTGVR